jgi:hypothetical protein
MVGVGGREEGYNLTFTGEGISSLKVKKRPVKTYCLIVQSPDKGRGR